MGNKALSFFFVIKSRYKIGGVAMTGYDIITWVILGAAVIYYFIVPSIAEGGKAIKEIKAKPKDDEEEGD